MASSLTLFGGTGDLTLRKLLPALYNLVANKEWDTKAKIIIIGRRDYDHNQYCDMVKPWVKKFARLSFQEETFDELCHSILYFQMDFTNKDNYHELNHLYDNYKLRNHIFYFAVSPQFFSIIIDGLKVVEHSNEASLMIEKPFGENLKAAKLLNKKMEDFFIKDNIYRIDHYLGKEMIRNIQTIRFTNPIFSNIWNHEFIESIQISAFEDIGVENRGDYYDQSGALKDMVQNHLLQILSIIAMEQPSNNEDAMHEEQLKVLRSMRSINNISIKDTMVMGQYDGYQSEPKVAKDSKTETYVGLRLFIDNERWQDMPFYIRSGKKLNKREMEVAIVFKQSYAQAQPNVLVIKIQPMEGIYLQFNIKKPGNSNEIMKVNMDFCQSCLEVNRINTPDAYERLLLACIKKEPYWFSKWDQIELSWDYMERLHQLYLEEGNKIYSYPPGSAGPRVSDELLKQLNHVWFSSIIES
ncbi:MAG: glucose-6-phosphate dehydrogenase [Erysipelotrichaceae bacterium]